MDYLQLLRCPITNNDLELVNNLDFSKYELPEELSVYGNITHGLLDRSRQYFYPVFNDIIILLQQYAIFIGKENDVRKELSFDKKRVFDYYNEVSFVIRDSFKIYEDSSKWVDYREVSSDYIRNSHSSASGYLPGNGEYLLDIASGPIGLTEYMNLANGYEFRICVDISINALIQAKANIEKANKKGIYICGDITNIPLKENSCDAVLSQHTLYHIPKNDQYEAVNELYRVAKKGSRIVIIYSWFYHSWFMNLSLNFVQLYRILRHFAGKLYVRMFKSKPRLYFYAHSPGWFKKSFEFSDQIEFYCWRSTNNYFLKMYIHKWFFGKRILQWLMKFEERHSKFMSTFGEYPAIVITK